MKCPLVIPLGNGSRCNNDELRILLRSVQKNVQDPDNIVLVTDFVPNWVKDVVVLPYPDGETSGGKDANLISKVLHAIRLLQLDSFALCADDNVFNLPCRFDSLPLLYNPRGEAVFKAGRLNRWRARVVHTFEFARAIGKPLDRNFETHTPTTFHHAQDILNAVSKVDYRKDPGLTLYTLLRLFSTMEGAQAQDQFKTTCESPQLPQGAFDKLFIGYNDAAFINGLRDRLFRLYPDKSRYER